MTSAALAPAPEDFNTQERVDLAWLLAVLDDWLLYAEPGTVQELGRFLHSMGLETTPPAVLRRLGELRRRSREVCS